MFAKFLQRLPVFNFCVASSALIFQTTVLYPWHLTLDKDFAKLEAVVEKQTHHIEALNKLLANAAEKK